MAFYDKEIKRVCESCPRLLILLINSVFSKHHAEDAEIVFLDKEQTIDANENTTYMDMFLEIENCKYHIEYQLLEGNMAILSPMNYHVYLPAKPSQNFQERKCIF